MYDNRDWELLQDEYVDSAWAFSEPFVLTVECFQENVFVCSAETFTPYGDAVMINDYMNNYDSMTPTEKWVQWTIMVWAVLTPGNKKTNKWLVKKVDDVLDNVQDVNKSITPVIRNWYVEVNWFKFTEYYYSKLMKTKRKAPSLISSEVLVWAKKSGNITPDPMGFDWFYRYEYWGREMIYNPNTKVVSHLQPIN